MKRLAMILAGLVLVAAIVIGVLSGQKGTLQREKNTVEEIAAGLSKQVKQLQAQVDEGAAASTSWTAQRDKLMADAAALQKSIDELTAQKTALETKSAQSDVTMGSLSTEHQKLSEGAATLQKQVDTLTAEKKALEDQLAQSNTSLNNLNTERTLVLQALGVNDAVPQGFKAEEAIKQLALERQLAQDSAASLAKEKEALQTQVNQLKETAAAAETEKTSLTTALVQTKDSVTGMTAERDSLRGQLLEAGRALQTAVDEKTALQNDLNVVNTAKAELEKQYQELKTQAETLQKEAGLFKEQNALLTTQLEEVKQANVTLMQEKASVEAAAIVAAAQTPAVAVPAQTAAPAAAAEVKATGAATVAGALDATAQPAAKGTKVVVWHTFTEAQEKALQEIAAAYTQQNPNVEVVVQSQPYQGFRDKVFNAVRTKTGPNLVIDFASEAAKYIGATEDETFVLDYTKYLTPADLDALKAALPEKIYAETTGFTDGKMHIVPVYTSGPIFFYNKTMYDELGLKVPTTWEELASNAKAIKDKYNIPGFAMDGVADIAHMLMFQNGSDYLDVAGKKALFGNPKAAERLQWAGDLIKQGVFTITPNGDYFSTDFNAKQIGSFIGSVAGVKYIKPDGFEFGVAPAINDGSQKWYPAWNRGAIAFRVNEEADKATVDFIKFFTNPENSAEFAMAVGSLSPYKAVAEMDAYKTYLNGQDVMAQALKAVQDNLQYAGFLPTQVVSATARKEIERALARVGAGEVTAEVALKEAVDIINNEWNSN